MGHLPITPDILSRFRYDPDTPSGLVNARTGKPAGCVTAKGYWRAGPRVAGRRRHFRAHRIVWALHHGDPGDLEVDHIDGDPGNNKLENLQAITTAQNLSRKTGKGYTWSKASGKWRARLKVGGKTRHLGWFDNEEEARAAYVKAKAEVVEGLSVELD